MTVYKKNNIQADEILMLLRIISRNPQISQRELSSSLGFSLGKVNFLVKASIERGLVKAHNFRNSRHKISYLYFLTPNGVEEKAKITYRFLKRKIAEYKKLETEIRQLKKEVGFLNNLRVDQEDM